MCLCVSLCAHSRDTALLLHIIIARVYTLHAEANYVTMFRCPSAMTSSSASCSTSPVEYSTCRGNRHC